MHRKFSSFNEILITRRGYGALDSRQGHSCLFHRRNGSRHSCIPGFTEKEVQLFQRSGDSAVPVVRNRACLMFLLAEVLKQ